MCWKKRIAMQQKMTVMAQRQNAGELQTRMIILMSENSSMIRSSSRSGGGSRNSWLNAVDVDDRARADCWSIEEPHGMDDSGKEMMMMWVIMMLLVLLLLLNSQRGRRVA
jgi:hypothetical protein